MTVEALLVDGVELPMPEHNAVSIGVEKIWSSNTGRLASSGETTGTIVAIKTTFDIKWGALNKSDIDAIEAAVSNFTPWHTITLRLYEGSTITKKVYFGALHYNIYSLHQDLPYVVSANIKAIEK